jgi:hypothetical protein
MVAAGDVQKQGLGTRIALYASIAGTRIASACVS